MSASKNTEDNAGEGDSSVVLPQPASTTADLSYLSQVSEIVVKQSADVLEMTRGTEEPNRYVILNKSTGENLYKAIEDESACAQQVCCSNRPFCIRLVDKFNREIIKIIRPCFSCGCCCGLLDCCDAVQIWTRNYKSMRFEWTMVGRVKKLWCPIPFFKVYDKDGSQAFVIKGLLSTCGPSTFKIKTSWSSNTVGNINKEWSGLCREATSDYDLFSLNFPPAMDDAMKATLMGALFFIDFKFYEGNACNCCALF